MFEKRLYPTKGTSAGSLGSPLWELRKQIRMELKTNAKSKSFMRMLREIQNELDKERGLDVY